jgi:hypothetical protein
MRDVFCKEGNNSYGLMLFDIIYVILYIPGILRGMQEYCHETFSCQHCVRLLYIEFLIMVSKFAVISFCRVV